MNERKIGILLGYLNIGLQAIIGIIYVPLLLMYIGQSEYGIYQLIGSLIAYFGIMDFGITATLTRYYTMYKANNDKRGMENILFLSLIAFICITIFLLIVGFIIYANLSNIFSDSMNFTEIVSAKKIFILLLINILFTISTMSFKAIMNAHERFFAIKGLETIQLVLQPILIIAILHEYPSAFSVALVQTILNILLSIIRCIYCFFYLKIKIRYHYFNSNLAIGLCKLSVSTFAVALIDQIFFRTNQIILGIESGTSAVAIYSIAAVIYFNYMSLSWAISGIFLPHVTSMVAKKVSVNELSKLFIKIGKWQYYVLMLCLLGFIILGKEFIVLWAGKEYLSAYFITIVIIVPFTIDLIQNIGICILQAYNKYEIRAKVYFFMGVANILLGIPAAKYFGGLGCAAVTGIIMFLGNGIIMNYYYWKKIHLNIKEFWYKILLLTYKLIIFFIIMFYINLQFDDFNTSWILFAIKILLFIIIYLIVLITFCFDNNEKNYIRNMFSKIKL